MKHFSPIIISTLCCIIVGCGPSNPDGRENVTGTIKLNGKPLVATGGASIFFNPIDGGDPQAGGYGPIGQDGKYFLTMQSGVKPGKYKVSFSASDIYDLETGKPATDTIKELNGVNVSLLPPVFSGKASTLEFEVVQGKDNIFDYDIVTDYQPQIDSKRTKGRGAAKAMSNR